VRFGPDSKLYLALDDGGRAARAGDLGSYNGKVLRLNGDASTPSDQPGGNPVYVGDINQPRGVAWSKSQPVLWIVQTASGGAAELRAVVRDTLGRSGQAGRIVARYVLPQGITPGQMTIYQHERVPALRNNLLIAAGSQGILRVQFDAANPTRVVSSERLQIAPDVRAVAEGGDGSILVATGERLLKIVP
jgi:glucose/arabinose dehydrogenase